MERNSNYNTKQKEIILDIIRNYHQEFTVQDIYENVKDSVGLTTIYRFIDKLLNENMISKSIGKDNITYYQYLEKCEKHNHFYLKCNKCKKMIHIDCDCIEELSNHIYKKHCFTLSKENIIINGLCETCIKGECL